MPESPTFKEEVEHAVDAIANDGATYVFKKPIQKIQSSHLPSVSRNGIHGGDMGILQRRKSFFNEKTVNRKSDGNFFVVNDELAAFCCKNFF